jgi:hypothetical protein
LLNAPLLKFLERHCSKAVGKPLRKHTSFCPNYQGGVTLF